MQVSKFLCITIWIAHSQVFLRTSLKFIAPNRTQLNFPHIYTRSFMNLRQNFTQNVCASFNFLHMCLKVCVVGIRLDFCGFLLLKSTFRQCVLRCIYRQCGAGCKASLQLLLFVATNRSRSCSTLQSRMLVICAIIWRVKLCSIFVRCL